MRCSSDKHRGMFALTKGRIYIVGRCRVQNDLLASFLQQITGVMCHTAAELHDIPTVNDESGGPLRLVLLDCLGLDPESLLVELESVDNTMYSQDLVALFNLNPTLRIEEEILMRGVRGFFYIHDPLEQFRKGVRAIFNGELWVSREIMTRMVLDRKRLQSFSRTETRLLSRREVEILTMVASGTKNTEIATKLYISPHTVKTHLYNIYKKIKVSSRLEAAFWASRNL